MEITEITPCTDKSFFFSFSFDGSRDREEREKKVGTGRGKREKVVGEEWQLKVSDGE